jgi:putative exporter of polyketide antibiotics
METSQIMLTVGFLFVLPQIVGLTASRVARRGSAIPWALAASGIIGVLWAVAAIVEHHWIEQAGFDGQFNFGEAVSGTGIVAVALMVFHFAVGSILGVLDQRARSRRPN